MTHYTSKSPSEVLDYTITYATALGADTIATSTWAVTSGNQGLTISSPAATNTSTTTTVWLSAGTLGQIYVITNTITTAGGRTIQDSISITIQSE